MPGMPRKKPTPPADGRKARRDDPPYMVWRQGAGAGRGKGKWEPGPALRKGGWTVLALKDARGEYLPRGLARIMAREINRDVEAWQADPAAPGRRYGPLRDGQVIASPDRDARTIANAFERFKVHPSVLVLSAKTQDEYRKNLSRFVDWAGAEDPQAIDRQIFTAWREAEWDRIFASRALGWSDARWQAAPRAVDPDGAHYVAEVRAARWAAIEEARENETNPPGRGMINAIVRAVSRFYGFIDTELNWVPDDFNPAAKARLKALKPRLVLPSDEALALLVATADEAPLPAIGDALVILANAGPRPADMVTWTMDMWATGRITSRIRKTGGRTDFKFPKVLQRRMTMIQTRRAQAGHTAQPLVLVTDAQRVAFTPTHLSHTFEQVRAAAAAQARSQQDHALAAEIEGLQVYDFRKKAITRLHAAGNSRDDIAAITGHSYKTINTILDHYIIPTREAADRAVDKLDAYMTEKGVKW